MESVVKSPVMLYTEQTPNPESLKFVTNKMLYRGTADFREAELANEWSPMAAELFKKDYVNGVYICNNFVTITKNPELDWSQIMLEAKEWIKKYVESGDTIVKEGFAEVMEEILAKEEQERYSGDDAEIVKKIKDLIDTYVKPAVESDGGNIEFKSYDKGIVSVILQGSCSGCPSSTVTLKSGIEGMLKRMIPEVKEVVAENG
ncbi:MAG TPA: NifU family protein [Saprospiraceae bacterium]|nr:NifU family protein [Saprospiraceae bacterium]MCB9329335.1 NifU family protein [Lewinellaceae bacterium]HPK10394.1 NifU family protein [Saprospiraceae bacterium]HRX29807.1 NifU family protein [Saprospiraceae bacterium]